MYGESSTVSVLAPSSEWMFFLTESMIFPAVSSRDKNLSLKR